MAKSWKSLWDDREPDDKEPKKTKKSSSSSSGKWWHSENDEDDKDDKNRTTIGFHTSRTEDDRASSDYGGYGYSGYEGYGYYDRFDDSDADWYRRGSWRYSSHADYSPSSQFRSTFTRYISTGSADDDAKNKAIRALRNLTRSANTIVDKAMEKQGFAVQFSSGADSNGVTAALNDEKQRVVFVSPDELLDTKTTEDEDAVVDALTGFVLLRVQLSQDVKPEVIKRVNATGLHTAAFRAVERIFCNKDKLSGLDAGAFGRETADDYMAGLLAKSMLTRLARRNVVSNWGGFAPYFIRHAKKFAAVRENLEKAEKSVETVICTIGYNMLADESQLDLPKEINDIASKHLGAELKPEELLDACRALVTEIREFLAKAAPEGLPAGVIEKALTEMMAEAQAAQSAKGAGQAGLRDLLEKVGGAMASSFAARKNTEPNPDTAPGLEALAEQENDVKVLNELKKAMSLEQLLKALEAWQPPLESAKKLYDEARSTDGAATVRAAKSQLAYSMSSRPQGAELLRKAGIKEVGEFDTELANGESYSGAGAKEKVETLEKRLAAVCEKARGLLKEKRAELKKLAGDRMDHMAKRLDDALARTTDATSRVQETTEEIKKLPDSGSGDPVAAQRTLENLKDMIKGVHDRLQKTREALDKRNDLVSGARTLNTLQKEYNSAFTETAAAIQATAHCFYDNYMLHSNSTFAMFSSMMHRELQSHENPEEAIEAAVDGTLSSGMVTDLGFMSQFINGFLGDMLTKNLDAEIAEKKKLADELGISTETLNKLLSALRNALSSGKKSDKAASLGEKLREQLADAQTQIGPVDRHLFGDKIETKTKILTGESLNHVNDEARNAAEEEYVAYLDHVNCKPKATLRQEENGGYRRSSPQQVINHVKTRNRGAIDRIRNALQFQSGKRTIETYGMRSGDLDEGGLHKLSYDCEHIWAQKTISKLPDVAVGILVDQSGSMSGPKIEQARELCITLAEAIRKISGVRMYVYGHTANMDRSDLVIYEHYKPAMGPDMTRLGSIEAHCNNYDGYAIKDVAKRLAEDPAKKKYLFVIADGLPSGHGYGGDSACKHVASVCKFSRERLKIGTYAFAVGVNGHQQKNFKQQYGDNHVVFVNNVMKCLPQIVRFLRNALQQERKLVTIDD